MEAWIKTAVAEARNTGRPLSPEALDDLYAFAIAVQEANRLWRSTDDDETIDSIAYMDMLDEALNTIGDAAIARAEGRA